MAVIEVQLNLPPEIYKNNVLTWPHFEDEILLIEEILRYEGTVFGEMGNGALSNEKSQFGKVIATTLIVDS